MSKWKEVVRCKNCGKIYPRAVPLICEKCGTEIAKRDSFWEILGIDGIMTDNAEKVIARRKLLGWEFWKAQK